MYFLMLYFSELSYCENDIGNKVVHESLIYQDGGNTSDQGISAMNINNKIID